MRTLTCSILGSVALLTSMVSLHAQSYVTLSGTYGDYTFQSDTTYFIDGEVDVTGTATFEGGTVLKFPWTGTLVAYSNIVCQTGPYRPAIFTSSDDNSVGQTISGSTGSPGIVGDGYLVMNVPQSVHDLRMSYAYRCIVFDTYFTEPLSFNNLQVCNSYVLIEDGDVGGDDPPITLNNCLINGIDQCAFLVWANAQQYYLNNCTFVWVSTFNDNTLPPGNYGATVEPTIYTCTNCVFGQYVDMTAQMYGDFNGIDLTDAGFGNDLIVASGSQTLQSVGAGNCYLFTNDFRGQGTTNIDPGLLAELRLKTTIPPVVYSNITISSNLVLSPCVPRDTNAGAVDLGYHYDPLDYAFGQVGVGANVTVLVTNGAAVACFGNTNTMNGYTYGMLFAIHTQLISQGSPTALNHIVDFNTVQEGPSSGWITPQLGMLSPNLYANPVAASCRFTDFSIVANDTAVFENGWFAPRPLNLQDCQFHGGSISSQDNTSITNCLFERVSSSFATAFGDGPDTLYLGNCLFWNGSLALQISSTNSSVEDNEFYGVAITDSSSTGYIAGYNAYFATSAFLTETNGADLFLTSDPGFQTGPLGNYYQPNGSPLINAGSTTADLLGLYWYTTTTDQVPETNSIADIGYHYVALGTNGLPLD